MNDAPVNKARRRVAAAGSAASYQQNVDITLCPSPNQSVDQSINQSMVLMV